MQRNSPGYFTISTFIGVFTSLLVVSSVFAQTADTSRVDTPMRPANATAALPPLKQLVSDVAMQLAHQQQYQALSFDSSKRVHCRIEKSDPLYKLPGGESRAVLIRLPEYKHEYMLTISSMPHGIGFTWRMFAPTVVFLDSLFRPARLLPEKQFSLTNSGRFQGSGLMTELRMGSEHSADKYLLIFTMKSGKRLETYSDAGTLAPAVLNHPVEGSPEGRIEFAIYRN